MLNGPFNPSQVEFKWNDAWLSNQTPYIEECQAPFSIVIPPPNVTGTLHMGHGFQMTLMDTLIRFNRMNGHPTHWQMGTDHAGIATQMVVERRLHQDGTTKESLGREAFTKSMWDWVDFSGDHIRNQIKRMGFMVDWSSERFTLDPELSKTVQHVFQKMYHDGLIYQGEKMVNWDTQLKTAVSDLEVVSESKTIPLYTLQYTLSNNPDQSISVATTRPETLFGDQAIAVHPDDSRYQHLIGQTVCIPLTQRHIPIIADDYVDPEFGTGCVKITPAHDFNDFEVGKRHQLKHLNIMNQDGTLNHHVPQAFQGLDRFVARKRIVASLDELGLLQAQNTHQTQVPYGDRSQTILEPRLTRQWFMKMSDLAKRALTTVQKGDIQFHPSFWVSTYEHWLNNIEDWCISRQLWWGHRIPCWYDDEGKAYVGSDETSIRQQYQLADNISLQQDEDVLDTWFSSALWPFSTMDWPNINSQKFQQFFPSHVLITGHDLIFFWVARMIMMSLYLTDEIPFKHVYFTGLIKDPQGQKMSKSKGNVVDPIDLIEGSSLQALIDKRTRHMMQPQLAEKIKKATQKSFPNGIDAHGTDALRFTFLALSGGNLDIRFDFNRLTGYKHFANKIWNASRLILMNTPEDITPISTPSSMIDHWLQQHFNSTITAVHQHIIQFRFDLAAQTLHTFVWGIFCDWYLELIKPQLHEKCQQTLAFATSKLMDMLTLMHPFMPYVTEEIYQSLPFKKGDGFLINTPYPVTQDASTHDFEQIETLKSWVSAIRTLRAEIQLPQSTYIDVFIATDSQMQAAVHRYQGSLKPMIRGQSIHTIDHSESINRSCLRIDDSNATLYIPLADLVGLQQAISGSQKKLDQLSKNIAKTQSKLDSPQFIERAPELAKKTQEQLHDYQMKHDRLKQHLDQLLASEI
ncbi:MAG: valine--tRNA ligase [Candidatus Comchoanobacterales bacterium]